VQLQRLLLQHQQQQLLHLQLPATCRSYIFDSVFFCRELYGFEGHFFLISAVDGSKSYHPESKIIIDLTTAYTLFGNRPDRTIAKIGDAVRSICETWNQDWSENRVSSIFLN